MEYSSKKVYPTNSDEYVLYEEVGQGVSAVVYRAFCIPLKETVAIKILDLETYKHSLDVVRQEVQTMSLIDHPNLLRAYCSFIAGRRLWIVMPYMAGGSFSHIMKTAYPEGFEQPVIATALRQVLKALAYLHSHGHIHRDVKAGNILVDSRGTVKVADFGVSASMFDAGDRLRPRNSFVGTPCWMAPEVMQQLHGYDYKADIWSFGITALELAHGHAPFSKYPPMKVLLMTLQNAPPGLDYERDKKFSKSFKEIVAACLVKDPKERPSAAKLLKHRFFKYARSNEFLAKSIFEGLSSLADSFKQLQGKDSSDEQLSQMQYLRGISAWNFDLEDWKRQVQDFDGTSNTKSQNSSSEQESRVYGLSALAERQSEEQTNKSNSAESTTSEEESLKDARRIESSATQLPNDPPEANDGQLLCNQKTDNNAFTSVGNALDELIFQPKGQFKDNVAASSHQDSNSSIEPLAEQSESGNSSATSATLTLSSLQCILRQNTMQREQILRLISYAHHITDNNLESMEAVGNYTAYQTYPASAREDILQLLVDAMQESIGKLDEDLQILKMKNNELETQLLQLLKKG